MDRRVKGWFRRGGAIDMTVDGVVVRALKGETIAAALFAAGTRSMRTSARRQSPRGLYCGMGVCFECVMIVDGVSSVRTCQTAVRAGMILETQEGCGKWTPTETGR